MRKLKTSDAFAFCRIIKKANLKEELSQVATKAASMTGEEFQAQVGLELFMSVLEGVSSKETENEIYEFVGSLADKTAKEIEGLELTKFIDLLKQIAEENDLKSFFTSALGLMK